MNCFESSQQFLESIISFVESSSSRCLSPSKRIMTTLNSDEKTNKIEIDLNNYKNESNFVNPLLTDLYQITMTYAYFINNSMNQNAVFDLFFRKCPFKGEYCIFAGLDDVMKFLNNFHFTKEQIKTLSNKFPKWDKKFWEYLLTVNASKLKVFAIREGSVVFPREPLIRVEGPLAICQLIETTLLNLVNYASLITTNACRMRVAVGPKKSLLEFGLRRAQGPDGGMSASRYAYMGGFDGTSNVSASVVYNLPVKGTHAHSFVTSYQSLEDLNNITNYSLKSTKFGTLKDRVLHYRKELDPSNTTNDGELAAFISYANAFPDGFLALIDTYNTEKSGLVNFIIVALALNDFNKKAIGIRLDSGDLAYLSKQCRNYFIEISNNYKLDYFKTFTIVASNDIHEEILYSLNNQNHEIDSFGIGTHLVTCKAQPALGCVYKLVEINNKPRIKASNEITKMTLPGKKQVYRLYSKNNEPLVDLMVLDSKDEDTTLKIKQSVRCYHPHNDMKRVDIVPSQIGSFSILCYYPSKIEQLLIKVFDGKICRNPVSLNERRKYCMSQVESFRDDYKRFSNPTPYKVSISKSLRSCMKELIENEIPVQSIE